MYNKESEVLKMNCVIYGDEKLLMEQKLNALKKKYDIYEENMNMMTYWCQETPMAAIIEDALTPPFLSEYKMIVVRNPLFLTTQKQKDVSEDDIKMLLEYLSRENPTTIFIIYHDQRNFDERKKVVKALRKSTQFIDVEKMDYHQLYKATSVAIKKRGCEIEEDALELFLSRMPNDLLEISQEVNKLCLYSHHITREVIDKMVVKQVEENVFELTKAILNKELAKSVQIYKDLVMNNEEPIKLIVLIANSMRLLYQVKLLDRKGYNDREIGQILALNPYRLKYIRQDGKDYEIKELLTKIEELSQLDVDIKTGKIDRYRGLELFLMRLGGNHEWNH
ncbi:DNA polymerase III subunit delta [Candidatus Stoquefichus massiliensis]|uniref:DNA polymerase III subunit delta n=1 Tax=Candidatus Stoquefichus massiliensis TaxID=1470350 RepID=UPI0004ACF2A7|nr:DNA polymerase III subunit delta [Candidatus Stoquefichus massiliensis]